jgi:protein TonB
VVVKPRRISTLQFALGLSLAVHAALLTVRFVAPQALERALQDSPLEVILVNARSADHPERPQAIAQTRMAGGGEAARGRAASPLPSARLSERGDTVEDEAHRREQLLRQKQTQLLAQVRQQLAALTPPEPQPVRNGPEQTEQERRRRLLLKQLAEIERRIQLENEKPRKRYIGPSTREESYALYYDRLRRAIEVRGTENFPTTASGKKLYGELTMVITVNHRGQVVATEVAESSGSRALDRRAEAIVRSAAPFGRFSESMRKEAEQIVVVSRFRFARDETLQTRVSTP